MMYVAVFKEKHRPEGAQCFWFSEFILARNAVLLIACRLVGFLATFKQLSRICGYGLTNGDINKILESSYIKDCLRPILAQTYVNSMNFGMKGPRLPDMSNVKSCRIYSNVKMSIQRGEAEYSLSEE